MLIGVGALVLAAVLMLGARFVYTDSFARRTEVYDERTAGQAVTPEAEA